MELSSPQREATRSSTHSWVVRPGTTTRSSFTLGDSKAEMVMLWYNLAVPHGKPAGRSPMMLVGLPMSSSLLLPAVITASMAS